MENKPMIIAIEEAERMLLGAVNTALANGVTPYFLGMVFDKVHAQIKELAQNEMKAVKQNWENQKAEEAKKKPEITEV